MEDRTRERDWQSTVTPAWMRCQTVHSLACKGDIRLCNESPRMTKSHIYTGNNKNPAMHDELRKSIDDQLQNERHNKLLKSSDLSETNFNEFNISYILWNINADIALLVLLWFNKFRKNSFRKSKPRIDVPQGCAGFRLSFCQFMWVSHNRIVMETFTPFRCKNSQNSPNRAHPRTT